MYFSKSLINSYAIFALAIVLLHSLEFLKNVFFVEDRGTFTDLLTGLMLANSEKTE